MTTLERRTKIESILNENYNGENVPISATSLADIFSVSRQIIVGDIAILRSKGIDILSTPRGYMLTPRNIPSDYVFKIACKHSYDQTAEEIMSIVKYGGKIIDVIVEHSLYGQIIGQLNISTVAEAEEFLNKCTDKDTTLLSDLTEGIHVHTISCKDISTSIEIKNVLEKKRIIYNK